MAYQRSHRSRTLRKVMPLAGLLVGLTAIAQHADQDLPAPDSAREQGRLYEMMRHGLLEGRFRQYTMVTINDGAPSDYHAFAFGGSLGYASQRWHGLQFKLSGGYTFDLGGSDLTVQDPVTGLPNRYEIGLFDVLDPRPRNDVAYLQEFQLSYLGRSKRTRAVFGRQALNTPFLNPQDGRMHPSLFEGLWTEHRTMGGTVVQGGWLYRLAPRSTSAWFTVAESMSLYPSGRNVSGTASSYDEALRSAGILAASVKQPLRPGLELTAWDLFVENVFNTTMLQVEMGTREQGWSVAAMGIHQTGLGAGTMDGAGDVYMPKGETPLVFSARIRQVPGLFRWQFNYTRITSGGRYLMPREWGRDPFFTFLPRERNEGLGDVHAATLNLILRGRKPGLRLQADVGIYRLPALSDARLNKYAMPSYCQFDLNAQYQFQGEWKGLAVQLLYLVKLPLEPGVTERQAFNKVDMHHLDLIINYAF